MMMMIDDQINNNKKIMEIPVIFYDGEREIDLGKVDITPIMTFKLLQSTLSNKIGISPNHITIYFDRNNIHHHHQNHHNGHRRRHPVTSKFDFSSVEPGSCFFWVVLKRGRRNRRRRNGKNDAVESGPFVLLRRGGSVNDTDWDYINRLRMLAELERERERYYMSLNLNSNVYNELSGYNHNHNHNQINANYNNYDTNYDYDYNNGNYGGGGGMSVLSRSSGDDYDDGDGDIATCSSSTGGASSERVFCDVCNNSPPAGGDTVPFHWCKNDVVVSTGFRSLVGPIAPPGKNKLLG